MIQKATRLDDSEKEIVRQLLPELRPHVTRALGLLSIHSPLLVTLGILPDHVATLNAIYLQKKQLAKEMLAEIRRRPLPYLCLAEKPYRLDAFIEIRDRLSDAQYWSCLEYVWSLTERTHQNLTDWLWLFSSKRRYRELMMARVDRRAFGKLPDTLTIYRGYQSGRHRHKSGLSWTLSKETASWFAYRHPNDGKAMLATGQCAKKDVICYTNGRKEQEIVINPRNVRGVRATSKLGPSPFKLTTAYAA